MTDAAKPNLRGKAPKLMTERTNGGAYFLDCSTCGSLGVWRDRTAVLAAKAEKLEIFANVKAEYRCERFYRPSMPRRWALRHAWARRHQETTPLEVYKGWCVDKRCVEKCRGLCHE